MTSNASPTTVPAANGFEVAPGGRPELGDLATALARNRAFAAAGGHEGAVVFPRLRLFVVTCLDPRVDPAHVLRLDLSDAMVVRNVGGRVTPEVINDVAFIGQIAENVLPDGPLFEVAVIHHTQCGTGLLADPGYRHQAAEATGQSEAGLEASAVADPYVTVKTDVERLLASPSLSPKVSVSGHVYDIATGRVTTTVDARYP